MPDTAANYRMLHTMIRVQDLDKSLAFYTGPMGMKLLRKREVPDGKYTLAFVGYGDESEHCAVELTYNWDQEKPYELGTRLRPSRGRRARRLWRVRAGHQGRRQGHARARAGEVRHDGDRLRRGSRRLQDRADRAEVGVGLRAAQVLSRRP